MTAYGLLERMADDGALGPDILPMAALRNLEAVVLGKLGEFHVAVRWADITCLSIQR